MLTMWGCIDKLGVALFRLTDWFSAPSRLIFAFFDNTVTTGVVAFMWGQIDVTVDAV